MKKRNKKKRGVALLALSLLAIGILLACVLYTCSNRRGDYDDEEEEETRIELKKHGSKAVLFSSLYHDSNNSFSLSS